MVVSTCTHAFIHPSIHLFLYLSVYLSVCLCTPIHKAQTAGAAEDWQIILVQIETNLNRFIFEIKCRKLIGESVYQIKSKEKMDTMYFASRRKDDRKFIFILSLFRSSENDCFVIEGKHFDLYETNTELNWNTCSYPLNSTTNQRTLSCLQKCSLI